MDQNNEKNAYLEGETGIFKGEKYSITKDDFIIGRSSDCDLAMKENTISARHTKISRTRDGFEIMDLDSTNGTFVNGIKVEKKNLRTSDKIKVDVFEFTFINPMDVPRTELSTPTESIKETIIRSQESEPKIHDPVSPEKTQPLLDRDKKKAIKTDRKGNLLTGLMLGLLISFLLSYGGVLLSVLIQNQSSNFKILTLFQNELTLFPLRYLHTTWMNVDPWTLAVGISLLSLVLGPFIGAIIGQDMGRKKQFTTAVIFSFFYVGIAALVQIILLKFNFNTWLNSALGSGLGITHRAINLIAVMAYFWVICFVFSFIGTLVGKKR
ncbi:MAG: FHA domain-containing protein [Candidatus Aminicenantes bacterium]|nr:FHA domain-containing protein [Candidatus Aminicenantes bacterium]